MLTPLLGILWPANCGSDRVQSLVCCGVLTPRRGDIEGVRATPWGGEVGGACLDGALGGDFVLRGDNFQLQLAQ